MSVQPAQHPLAKNFPIISTEVYKGNFDKLVDVMKTLTMFENSHTVENQRKICAKFIPLLEIAMDQSPDLLELINKIVVLFKTRGVFALEETQVEGSNKLACMKCSNGNVVINTSIFRLCNAFYRKLLVPDLKMVPMQNYSKRTVEIVQAWLTAGVVIIYDASLIVAGELCQLAGDIGEPALQEGAKVRIAEIAAKIVGEKELLEFETLHEKYFNQLDLVKVAVRSFLVNKGIKQGSDLLMHFADLVSFENNRPIQQILMKNVSICFGSEESIENSLFHFLDPAPFQSIRSITYILPRTSTHSYNRKFFDQCMEHNYRVYEKLPHLEKVAIIIPEPSLGMKRDPATIIKEVEKEYTTTSYTPVGGFTLQFFSINYKQNSDEIHHGSFQQVGNIHINNKGEMVFEELKE